jgi:hypothetical protein
MQPVLDSIARVAPEVHASLRLHCTGAAEPPKLDAVKAVLFWLGDPLRELYPDCYAEAREIAERARNHGIRVINPPEALSNSVKSVQQRLWRQAAIPTPLHWSFGDRAELEQVLAGCRYPILIKSDWLHTKSGMFLCRSAREALGIPDSRILYPGAVAEFIDTRESFRKRERRTLWARLYHKKRVIVLGGRVHPQHMLFSRQPLVRAKTSTYRRYEKRRWIFPLLLRLERDASLRLDRSYWSGEAEEPELFCKAAEALGLDFVAIDYSSHADGRVVLWEANPYFDVPREKKRSPGAQRVYEERSPYLVAAMTDFFSRLLAAPGSGDARSTR